MRLIFLAFLLIGCNSLEEKSDFDLQGHRGARGLLPENSIEGFLLAEQLGVHTLELDLVVSGDSQLVVSHEPYFSPDICLDLDGNLLDSERKINIFELSYPEIKEYDCGKKKHPKFSEQKKMPTFKPTLQAVFDAVKSQTTRPIRYNIELKTTRATDGIFHPSIGDFADLVYATISKNELWDRVNIQSFDFRMLQYFREKYPHVSLAVLIENKTSWQTNIDSLGFTPEIYSCYFKLLDTQTVKALQNSGMAVIPWTVNEIADLKKMLKMGVDGLITDYPDRAINLIK
ncbi:MAG: glycerophosphodiester phosphodiesterase family protein [Bacteroidota bacterium]